MSALEAVLFCLGFKLAALVVGVVDAIVVEGLSKVYGSFHALKNISFRVPAGTVFGVLGPNGAGKTSLLTILCGLNSADGGSAKVFGLDAGAERSEISRKTNLMRGFSNVPDKLSALELLDYYMGLYGLHDPQKARELLKEVGLQGEKGFVNEFSSGMRQRFFLAKALCNDPQLLFLDEPTVGLDVESVIWLREKILSLKKQGKTIMLTTHNLREAEELCDDILLLDKGRVLAQGSPKQLKLKVKEREAVRVYCEDLRQAARILRNVQGLHNAIVHETYVEAVALRPDALRSVMSVLSKAKFLKVQRVEMAEPPLEEAFLKLVRRERK